MKELTTQTGIIVKCSKTAIEFFQNAQSVDFFSALEIPKEFQDIAVEFYDLILENDHPTALLGCRGNYDIAVQLLVLQTFYPLFPSECLNLHQAHLNETLSSHP